MIEKMNVNDVKVAKPFSGLFTISQSVVDAIAADMVLNGYDDSAPIVLWDGIVVDGHTRLQAAKQAGLKEVYVFDDYDFKDENKAIEYAIHNQKDRRNLSDGALLELVERREDNRMSKVEVAKNAIKIKNESSIKSNSSTNIDVNVSKIDFAEEVARDLNIGKSKAQELLTVKDQASKKEKQDIRDGKISLHKVSTKIRQGKKAKKNKKIDPTESSINSNSSSFIDGNKAPVDFAGELLNGIKTYLSNAFTEGKTLGIPKSKIKQTITESLSELMKEN